MHVFRLCEGQTDCSAEPPSEGEAAGDYEPPPPPEGGCSIAGRGPAPWLVLLALLALVAQSPKRRTRV